MQGFIVVSEHMAQLYHWRESRQTGSKTRGASRGFGQEKWLCEFSPNTTTSRRISPSLLSGIDHQTKTFTEPPDQIKKEINSIKANKAIPEAQKREDLAQLVGRAKGRKAHSIQGKHRDGPQVFRSTFRRSTRRRDLRISVPRMRIVVTVPALLAAICGNMVLRADSELFTREQVQPSQDHHRHLCVEQGRDHRSICIFRAGRLRPGHSYAAVVKDRRPDNYSIMPGIDLQAQIRHKCQAKQGHGGYKQNEHHAMSPQPMRRLTRLYGKSAIV